MSHPMSPACRRANRHHRTVRYKKWWVAILVLFFMGAAWCGYVLFQIEQAKSTLKEPVDVGIILGASMWGDEPSPGLKERLHLGMELYQQGYFDSIIVTGGLDKPDYNYTEAEGMRNYLVKAGVPEEHIFLENKATSTYENLLYSGRIMEENGWNRAVIITHDYHGSRAMEIASTLRYEQPALSITSSNVLPMAKHKSREILAYTKWTVDRVLIALGLK